jgi:hypothetical protein
MMYRSIKEKMSPYAALNVRNMILVRLIKEER